MVDNQPTSMEPPAGGTNIEGDANIQNGDFVAGNKVIHIQDLHVGMEARELAEVLKRVLPAENAEKKAKRIPPLLPYLADRSEQEFKLQDALDRHQQAHPLIVIVHGDEFQCQDKYLERVQSVSLPRMLQLNNDLEIVKAYPLDWPARIPDLNELPRRIQKVLSDVVLRHSMGKITEIQWKLAEHSGPVLIHTHLLSQDWKEQGELILDRFIHFWQIWPELAPRQRLFIFIFVKYQVKYDSRGWLAFSKSLNERIAEQLEQFDFSQYAPLSGIVLKKLIGVTRSEAEEWARSPEVNAICDCETLISAIRRLYEQESKGNQTQISMEKLVDGLKAIMKEQISFQESVG